MTDFKAKMHQIRFRLQCGSAPDPAGAAYSAPPDPLAGLGGAASRQGRGWAGEEEGKREREGGEVEGREREGPQFTVEPGPPRALLPHCASDLPLFIAVCRT